MPQHTDPRHNLRLTTDLKKKLAHSAVDTGRSMNAEILARLDASFDPSPLKEIEVLLRKIAQLSDAERDEALLHLAKFVDILAKR